MGKDIRIYPSISDATWRTKRKARLYPCSEWVGYKSHICDYSGPLRMHGVDGWKVHTVYAGKYSDRTTYILTKQMEKNEWYQYMAADPGSWDGPNFVHDEDKDSYYIVTTPWFYGISSTWLQPDNTEFEQYAKQYIHTNVCKELIQDIGNYEGGTPVADVTFNEWKDADQGVITITAGRTMLNFTLTEAAQLLTAIPEAMRGYRDARVNAVQDQIKSLNEALAVLQQVPTQTPALDK